MKLHKLLVALALLIICASAKAKVYYDHNDNKLFDGKDFPVLDLVICLDKYKFANNQWTYYEKGKGLSAAPIFTNLLYAIEQEEVCIACSNLIRELIDKTTIKSREQERCTAALKLLNNTRQWINFVTSDQEFVVLLPRKKYNVTGLADLDSIGLNKNVFLELKSIDTLFYTVSELEQQTRLNTLAQTTPQLKTAGLIKHETLFDIFLENKQASQIMKRIVLSGHGYFQEQIQSTVSGPLDIKKPQGPTETGAAIAQLRPYQYIQFLEKMSTVGCSFLLISSCYSGGWNALTSQNKTFYEQKTMFEKFNSITDAIPFIIVVESTPDKPIVAEQEAHLFAHFFIEINKFFVQQKEDLRKLLTGEEQQLSTLERGIRTKNLKNNVSEIDILTGILLTPPTSLVEQKPWIINTLETLLKNIRSIADSTYSTVRFPGKPFFRLALKNDNTELIKTLDQLKNEQTLKAKALSTEIEGSEKYKKIDKEYTAIELEINQLESFFAPFKIDYPFLVHHELIHRLDKNKNITIQYPHRNALLYTSIINVPISISNQSFRIVSMIPGRAQHYINELLFDLDSHKKLTGLNSIFSIQKDPIKFYFIENITGLEDKQTINNVAIKNSKGTINFIYQSSQDKKYYDQSGKELGQQQAQATIKQWVLETTPAREAIFEATAGIETIYKFRIKINQIFPGLFTPEELGQKQTHKKQIDVKSL